MTKEVAEVILNEYKRIMKCADRLFDLGDTESYGEYLYASFALDTVLNKFGLTIRKAYDGDYVIVEM